MQCPICDGDASVALTAEDNHYGNEGTFSIHRCHDCGHMFQSPSPDNEQLSQYYPGSYYSFQAPEADLRPRGLRHRGVWLTAHYARLYRGYNHLPLFPNPFLAMLGWYLVRKRVDLALPKYVASGTICDFGCGAGAQLAMMQYLGWDASGIDVSEAAAAAGQRSKLKVIRGSVEALESRPAAFDVITASHSVEHVADPARLFRALFLALKPGGTLAVEVPNAAAAALDTYGKYYYYLTLPVHLNIFSPRSLELIARSQGFSQIALRTASYWRAHAESWLLRHNSHRGHSTVQFNSHGKLAGVSARVPSLFGFLRSLVKLKGDCVQLVCRRPVE